MMVTIFLISIVAIIAMVIVGIYNNMITKSNLVKEAWCGIDVQLKRRYDLLPSLIETVKGYVKHEKSTLEDIVKLRNEAHAAPSMYEKAKTEQQLSQAIKGISVIAENYPDLKASINFVELQKSLAEIEDNLQMARRYYNATVRDYNTLIATFPNNLVSKHFAFTEKEFFGIDEKERANVKVEF